jgi:hypothetical protein
MGALTSAMFIAAIFGDAGVNALVATITVATCQNVFVTTTIYPLVAIVLFCSSVPRLTHLTDSWDCSSYVHYRPECC